ncbi:MAG: ROK family protein, partial [Chloroflexi bacterium]|nr:ROK family protein [Chloroflexota bacterium]
MFVTGVDLGGTKIAAALAAPDGVVLGTAVIPTEPGAGPDAVVRRLAGAVRAAMHASNANHGDLARVAVGVPGPVDAQRGVVWTAPNLPGWREVPVSDLLASSLGVPVTLVNDAHAAALAEHRCGAGRGVDNMVYITLGTGVGGGIILNGELYGGARGTAGEIGHMILDPAGPHCSGGHEGCLEQFTSGLALAREARLRLQAEPEGLLWELCDSNPLQVTSQEVAAAGLKGD